MIRRGVVALAFLVTLFSAMGVVSAFEAHTINVKAHVENALQLSSKSLNFGRIGTGTGSVFPEEWLTRDFTILFSFSFCDELQVRETKVDYQLWATDKPKLGGGFFPWIGDALYVGKDVATADKFPIYANPAGDLVPVDPPPGAPGSLPSTATNGNSVRPILLAVTGTLNKQTDPNLNLPGCPLNTSDIITLGMDVPVFEGFYNEHTDVPGCEPSSPDGPKKPSQMCVPSVILTGDRNVETGITLGMDLIVQVTKIYTTEKCDNGIDDDLDGVTDELDCV